MALLRRGRDELGRPGHQPHVRPDRAQVVRVLPLDRLRDARVLDRRAVPGEGEAEALPVVEAEVVAVVGLAIEGIPILRERRDQRLAVLRLVVDDDAVEVEQDCRRHASNR